MRNDEPIKDAVRNLRRVWDCPGLFEQDASDNPIVQFELWMKNAVEQKIEEPNAMTLVTASLKGKPSARIVLLKDYSEKGFTFFTNYNSRKAVDLFDNPQASLVFFWSALSRQICIDGLVTKVDRQTSIEYFHSRPRASQIAAYCSHQSEIISSRDDLEQLVKSVEEKFKDADIPCPAHWGGYNLRPTRIEFWQGRPNRLHDRLCYSQKSSGGWTRERLAP